jgi:hypothetical protein
MKSLPEALLTVTGRTQNQLLNYKQLIFN